MAAVIFAGERIGALRGKGAELRQDGFFNETPDERVSRAALHERLRAAVLAEAQPLYAA